MSGTDGLKPTEKTIKKSPKGSKPQRRDGKANGPDVNLKSIDPSAFNNQAEQAAVEFLTGRIQDKGPLEFNQACNLVAFKQHVSVETAKRYIRKYSVDDPDAPFALEAGYVHIRQADHDSSR